MTLTTTSRRTSATAAAAAAAAVTEWLWWAARWRALVDCTRAAPTRSGQRVHELEFAEQLVDDVLRRGARHAAHHALAVAEHVVGRQAEHDEHVAHDDLDVGVRGRGEYGPDELELARTLVAQLARQVEQVVEHQLCRSHLAL